jgi:hypothetical protein
VYVIGLLCFIQPDKPRFLTCLSYASLTFMHEVFISKFTSLPYYSTAAIFDLMSMILMSHVKPVNNLIVKLSVLCVISIVLNFYGWLIYMLYFDPITYNIAFMLIYAVVIFLFVVRDKNSEHNGTYNSGEFSIRFSLNKIFNNNRKSKKSP